LAAITVKQDRLTRIGPDGSVHEFQIIELSSQTGLVFPIPIDVAAGVANGILELVPKNKPLHSMFKEKETTEKVPL